MDLSGNVLSHINCAREQVSLCNSHVLIAVNDKLKAMHMSDLSTSVISYSIQKAEDHPATLGMCKRVSEICEMCASINIYVCIVVVESPEGVLHGQLVVNGRGVKYIGWS